MEKNKSSNKQFFSIEKKNDKVKQNTRFKFPITKISLEALFYILLIGIALAAPIVSFASVNLVYPNSTTTVSVNTDLQ